MTDMPETAWLAPQRYGRPGARIGTWSEWKAYDTTEYVRSDIADRTKIALARDAMDMTDELQGITPSQPQDEVARQADLYGLDDGDQRGGAWLGLIILAVPVAYGLLAWWLA